MAEEFGIVEVQVGYWEGPFWDPGDFVGNLVRFEGNLILEASTGYETLRLYRCPVGFRVHRTTTAPAKTTAPPNSTPLGARNIPPRSTGTLRKRSC